MGAHKYLIDKEYSPLCPQVVRVQRWARQKIILCRAVPEDPRLSVVAGSPKWVPMDKPDIQERPPEAFALAAYSKKETAQKGNPEGMGPATLQRNRPRGCKCR